MAGPSDEVAVDGNGIFVATTSGRPLLLLEDLVVAIRSIDVARISGMRSIDPTPRALPLQEILTSTKQMPNPQKSFDQWGVLALSIVGGVLIHTLHILVAADYR